MASITKVNNKYIVRYDYKDKNGKRKQKWEEFFKKADAEKFKLEVELNKHNNDFIDPSDFTVKELMDEWLKVHASLNWQYKTYQTSKSLIDTHILPTLGEIKVQKLTPKKIEEFIKQLRFTKLSNVSDKNKSKAKNLSATTVGHIYTLLKSALDKAVEWRIIESNPVLCKKPQRAKVNTTIWSVDEIRLALDNINEEQLHLAVHLAFVCSLRIGEVLGITWDCVDFDNMTIHINKTLQRIDKELLEILPDDNLFKAYPPKIANSKTVLVLKSPKTSTSDRTAYITNEIKDELYSRKQKVDKIKNQYNDVYGGDNLVFALPDGYPVEPKLCEKWFTRWQNENDLGIGKIVFHELRHSSTTYKLNLSGGNIKAVQGDTGHSSADMVVNLYSHIQDESRRNIATLLEKDFYKDDDIEENKNDLNTILDMVKNNPQIKKELFKLMKNTQ